MKGRKDGGFEKAKWLKDREGNDIHMGQYWGHEEHKWVYVDQVEGVGNRNILVYPELIDWDNDGDLDLVMGGRRGSIGLRINEGSATKPAFSTKQQFVKAGGKYMLFNGQVSIEFADLNGDKLPDLIWSVSRGEIGWYPNVGSLGAPKFGKSLAIAKAGNDGPSSYPCITAMDYNGDQKIDVLVGSKDRAGKAGYWIYLNKK